MSDTSENKYALVNHRLKKVIINGTTFQLETITDIDLYESITQPAILGTINYNDYKEAKERFEIFPGDDVELVFQTKQRKELSLKFKLYGIEGDQILTNHKYYKTVFQFCSPWLYNGGLTRQISKPYKEKYIHEIVKDLLTECGANIGFIEPTEEKLENFVSPLWTPIHTIRYLATRAKTSAGKGGYLLWTDLATDKVNFASMEYIFKGSLGKADDIFFLAANQQYEGRVFEMSFESSTDELRFTNQGLYHYDVILMDYDRNKLQNKSKDIKKMSMHTSLGKYMPHNPFFQDPKYKRVKFCSHYPRQAEITEENQIKELQKALQTYQYEMLLSDIFKINVATFGQSERKVGMYTELDFPTLHDDKTKTGNVHYKGKHIIRDIRHHIDMHEYHHFISLASDGYKEFKRSEVVITSP